MRRVLYGLFDGTAKIGESLKRPDEHMRPSGSVYQEGYQSASEGSTRMWINCRLYNLNELPQLSNQHGTNTANRVLLLYKKEGIKGFRRLNGKFTIIIQDPVRTIIVRDRNGEGRMIYYSKSFFTDSYKRLSDFSSFEAVPDFSQLITFLSIGYIPSPHTALSGISKVPAGGVLIATGSNFWIEDLFSYDLIRSTTREPVNEDEAVMEYDHLLKQSLIRRTEGASTTGVLLSGGFDSGGNLATLREIYPGKIKTFSVGFRDNPSSELPYARQVANQFGTEHQEFLMDGSELEWLPTIIEALGDPFAESGVMLNYAALQMAAKEKPSVVIGGDANDQYFGAGIRETAFHFNLHKYGLIPLLRLFDGISDNAFFDHDNLAFRIFYQNQKILRVMEPELFGFHRFQLKKMFRKREIPPVPGSDLKSGFSNYEELFLQRNYFLHLKQTTNDVIIQKAARISDHLNQHLAFSYTDLDLFNFIQKLPVNIRARGSVSECIAGKGVTKFIHKKLISPKLPKEITQRGKQGGFSPLEIFFKEEVRRNSIYRYISGSEFAKHITDHNFLQDFFRNYEKLINRKPYWFWYRQVKSNQMFNLLVMTLWWDRVIGKKQMKVLSDYLPED